VRQGTGIINQSLPSVWSVELRCARGCAYCAPELPSTLAQHSIEAWPANAVARIETTATASFDDPCARCPAQRTARDEETASRNCADQAGEDETKWRIGLPAGCEPW
jgi:hypothetical protein